MGDEKTSGTQTYHKPLKELTLLDRFLFREAMDVPELFETLVGILFEGNIEFMDRPQTEKELGISPQLRTVRLDVLNMDVDGQVYTVEMQKENTHNLAKRSRFYQGQVDVALLPPGSIDFNALNDAYLVMICPFDPFDRGLCRYTFHMQCLEVPELELQDGAWRIFINTKGRNREAFTEEFTDLLDYLNATAEDAENGIRTEAVRKLHNGIQKLKQAETTGVRYMQEWEERVMEQQEAEKRGMERGLSQGLSQGETVKMISLIRKKLQKGKKEDEIAEALEESVSLVHKVKEILGTNAELSDLEIARRYFL